MEKICSLGITISLDDFGTGYSSLSYLKRFPINTLKIDRSFTMGIPDDTNDCAIASAIIGIAKQLRHKVIAEGVETEKQFNFLREAGCNELQGYPLLAPHSGGGLPCHAAGGAQAQRDAAGGFVRCLRQVCPGNEATGR
jgi:EAL domain-containing protein (putative c-di-GMP-specific phosphodiesterase class I)